MGLWQQYFTDFFFVNDIGFVGSILLIIAALIGLIISILDKLPIFKEVPSARRFLFLMLRWYTLAILHTLGQIFNLTFPMHFISVLAWILAGFCTYFFYVIKYTKTS